MNALNRPAMVLRLALSILVLATICTVHTVQSAEAGTRILTEKTVKLFLASYPDVTAIARKHGQAKAAELAAAEDQLAAVTKAAADQTAARELDAAAKEHGFSGFGQWAEVAQSVIRAYSYVKAGDSIGKANKKLAKAIRKIEKNDFLSEKQKAKLIKALRKGAGELLEEPPAENVAAVEPMMDEIEKTIR